jgi:3-deoxy-D-manno-octulosonate 8-phosphate phosphatase (KDO 8-P phosphatase)
MKKKLKNILTKAELSKRAKRIKLLLSDCDGVLTDTGAYYSEWGESLKKFSIRDGMGVVLLRNAGIECGFLSGETSGSLRRRAEKLNIIHVLLGVQDKYHHVKEFAKQHHLKLEEIAYIGDDVNDYELISILKKISLTAAPSDAISLVQGEVNYVCNASGGQGAFREFADWIIGLCGQNGKNRVQTKIQANTTMYQIQEPV